MHETEAEYPSVKSELAAIRFYIREIIAICGYAWQKASAGITNYNTLLGHIDRWRARNNETVLLATFNYDRLLDDALAQHPIGLRPGYSLSAYVNRSDYKLLKPHGSVDWGMRTGWHAINNEDDRQVVEHVIANIARIEVTNNYVVCGSSAVRTLVPGTPVEAAILPAIAIPVREKSEFACPDDHLYTLEHALPSVTHVLCIGWRGAELQFLDRFIKPLKSARFHIVAQSRDHAEQTTRTLSRWAEVRSEQFTSSMREGFSAFLRTPEELHAFLAS